MDTNRKLYNAGKYYSHTLLILCSPTMCSTQAGSGLTREYLTRNKHVSLFWQRINDEEKRFYDIDTWIPCAATTLTPRYDPWKNMLCYKIIKVLKC